MKIVDLINKLEDLYSTYDDEYKYYMGEPEIMIDWFDIADNGHDIEYRGFTHEIHIDKSADGVYDILRAFYIKEPENG